MRAVRLHEYGQRPVIEQVPEPAVSGPLDVIVRIGGAGLCRTDLHIVEGQWRDKSNVALSYTLGHENAGWVLGAGGLGHIGIQSLKALTAAQVIVVDRSAAALELARTCGADHTVLADGSQTAKVKELTDGHGCEALIDFVGEGGALEDGVAVLRREMAGSHVGSQ